MAEFHFSPRPNRAAEIRWREWGAEAFDEARAADKPLLLSISAVWCHWCHVMDETTYSDPGVIQTINERFIPIRVDNDRRPDINARYNQGGWPTTAMLTVEGELLKGATYVPPSPMRSLLDQVADVYADASSREQITARIAQRRQSIGSELRAGPRSEDVVDAAIPARVFSMIDAAFDEDFGGFGTDQKFPHVPVLHFLLDRYARERDPRARSMVERSLLAMAGGGMYDHVEGGFFRYSTTRDFSVPHFEKMLEDLGGLLLACARAAALFGDGRLAATAIDVRRYLDARLWVAGARAYGGSQDADERYYALDAEGRSGVASPFVDRTVYVSWNAQAAHALIAAGPLLAAFGADADEWTARGITVLDSLWASLEPSGAMPRVAGARSEAGALLGDQAWSITAALEACQATGSRKWLERAHALAQTARSLFDPTQRAFADRAPQAAMLGRLADPTFPLDENALMVRAIAALRAFDCAIPDIDARDVLNAWARAYRSYGLFAAGYASAVLEISRPPTSVTIVGQRGEAGVAALLAAARRPGSWPARIEVVDPVRDAARLSALGFAAEDGVRAYVCDERSCFARAASPDELREALSQARS